MRDLSLHLLDIVQNSLKAGASRIEVRVEADEDLDRLTVSVIDNGSGMSEDMLNRVTDPFMTSRTTRSVGLGVPLFREAATITGGRFTIESKPGEGTSLTAQFVMSSIDRVPLGDLADTFVGLVLSDPKRNYVICFSAGDRRFDLDLDDVRAELIDVPLNDPNVLEWLQALIREQQSTIFGGVLNEVSC